MAYFLLLVFDLICVIYDNSFTFRTYEVEYF